MKELQLTVRIDDHQPIGLGHLRGNLCKMLGASHADRNRQAEFSPDALADCPRNFVGWTEQMGTTSNVGEGLVD
ncbi:hypothetical protein ACVWXO_007103 [Bradyrhizobium sp. LM2.7]